MKNTKELTLNAMFITIIVIMAMVPFFGIFQVGPIAIQIIHIPVIVAGLLLGSKSGMINGFAFGAMTLYVALTRASGIFDPYFVNPLVSILPRILFGLSIGVLSGLLKNIIKKDAIRFSVVAFITTLLHTLFVFIALSSYMFIDGVPLDGISTSVGGFFYILAGIFASNGFLEAVAAAVVVPPIVMTLKRLYRKSH